MGAEVIVGYLVAQLVGAGARFADKQVDGLLEALYDRVRHRLGADDPALARLRTAPLDEGSQRHAQSVLARVASQDPAFRADLASLQRELDDRGAQQLLVHAPGADTVIGLNYGVVVRDGVVHVDQRPVDPDDLSEDPVWVKVSFLLGMALGMVGFGLFGYALLTWDTSDVRPGTAPPGLTLAGAVFFAGLVLAAVAQVGHSVLGPSRRTAMLPDRAGHDALPGWSAGSDEAWTGATWPYGPPSPPPTRRGRDLAVGASGAALGLVAGTLLGVTGADPGGLLGALRSAVDGDAGIRGVVVEQSWNLRSAPDGEVVGVVRPGDDVVVTCTDGNWTRLLRPRAGAYVWADGVSLDEAAPAC